MVSLFEKKCMFSDMHAYSDISEKWIHVSLLPTDFMDIFHHIKCICLEKFLKKLYQLTKIILSIFIGTIQPSNA